MKIHLMNIFDLINIRGRFIAPSDVSEQSCQHRYYCKNCRRLKRELSHVN